jgi:hypothetical protein
VAFIANFSEQVPQYQSICFPAVRAPTPTLPPLGLVVARVTAPSASSSASSSVFTTLPLSLRDIPAAPRTYAMK